MASAKATPRSSHISDTDQIKPVSRKAKLFTDFEDSSEYADLADKILENFLATLDKDELIDEFDIIPVESTGNYSPVIHDTVEHKIALESWCVPYLYTHSYKTFLAIKRKQKFPIVVTSCSRYGSLKASKLSEGDRVIKGVQLSKVLVLLNPDLAIAWNFRKAFVVISSFDCFQNEMGLAKLVASRKPKCPEAFSYKRWLVRKAIEADLLAFNRIAEWFETEITAIEAPTLRYFSNYHVWDYRLWLLKIVLENPQVPAEQKNLVIKSELNHSNNWINTHVSDHCGYHYREKLLSLSIQHSLSKFPVSLESELEENAKRIEMFENHETLWAYRRAVMNLLLNQCKDASIIRTMQDKETKCIALLLEPKSSKEPQPICVNLGKKYLSWTNSHLKLKEFNWHLDDKE